VNNMKYDCIKVHDVPSLDDQQISTWCDVIVKRLSEEKQHLKQDGVMLVTVADEHFKKPERTSVTIALTDDEAEAAKMIMHARCDPKTEAGVQSRKASDDMSEEQVMLIGVGAEIAVAKFFNVLPMFYTSLSGDKGTADLIIGGGKCEVKCRTKNGYSFALMSEDANDFKSDVGVLVYEKQPFVYELFGVISRARFIAKHKVEDYGHGRRAVAEPEHFSDLRLIKHRVGDLLLLPHKLTEALRRDGWFVHVVSSVDVATTVIQFGIASGEIIVNSFGESKNVHFEKG